MMERTKSEQILVLETLIKERALIIYTIESAIADDPDTWPLGYKTALEDEIENHKLAIQEYKEGLEKLK
jgi:hypothetical protein